MSKIKGKNTTPELAVRKLVYSLGYRYRLHGKNLPGKPDLVFKGKKKVIFVHGCFWHAHDCEKGRLPKTNLEYWLPKLQANKKRDIEINAKLISQGWKILTIWECQIRDERGLTKVINDFLTF